MNVLHVPCSDLVVAWARAAAAAIDALKQLTNQSVSFRNWADGSNALGRNRIHDEYSPGLDSGRDCRVCAIFAPAENAFGVRGRDRQNRAKDFNGFHLKMAQAKANIRP